MSDNAKAKKWTFGTVVDERDTASIHIPNLLELYKQSTISRESKRKMYETALNAALENIMSWERVARADGFDVVCATDMFQGAPHPIFDKQMMTVTFVQAYGVVVKEKEAS